MVSSIRCCCFYLTAVIYATSILLVSGSSRVKVTGCTSYGPDGACIRCARRYTLNSQGSCICAAGFRRASGSRSACVAMTSPCTGKCGATYLDDGNGGYCHCDYYCDNLGDCCGGAASKNANCPSMAPSLNKPRITNCDNAVGATNLTFGFKPGQCWCDDACSATSDCCPTCSNCNGTVMDAPTALLAQDNSKNLGSEIADHSDHADHSSSDHDLVAVMSQAEIMAQHTQHSDCGIVGQRMRYQAAMASIAAAAPANWESDAEAVMQECQASDAGSPTTPYVMAVHWTATRVCDNFGANCYGGDYSTALVQKQIDYLNAMYDRIGIQFTWDGVIHKAQANSVAQIDDYNWICNLPRYGEGMTVHVVTGPKHVGGYALGYTNYWSAYSKGFGRQPACYNWVHIYEKTLPDQGARSLIDGGLSDSGAVLAHEIGHQLMLHHTWFEPTWERAPISTQCKASASLSPNDVVAGRSDGVRDTTAQSLNTTGAIIRFVNCDPATGVYKNTTSFAQQSCNAASGFAQGESYFNNYNNLMSYGDRTCLRTLTPGQGTRARCAIKCMIQLAC